MNPTFTPNTLTMSFNLSEIFRWVVLLAIIDAVVGGGFIR